jgi:hypothetical protein
MSPCARTIVRHAPADLAHAPAGTPVMVEMTRAEDSITGRADQDRGVASAAKPAPAETTTADHRLSDASCRHGPQQMAEAPRHSRSAR